MGAKGGVDGGILRIVRKKQNNLNVRRGLRNLCRADVTKITQQKSTKSVTKVSILLLFDLLTLSYKIFIIQRKAEITPDNLNLSSDINSLLTDSEVNNCFKRVIIC